LLQQKWRPREGFSRNVLCTVNRKVVLFRAMPFIIMPFCFSGLHSDASYAFNPCIFMVLRANFTKRAHINCRFCVLKLSVRSEERRVKEVNVGVDLGGGRIIKKKKKR
jgi:hypothetical protein